MIAFSVGLSALTATQQAIDIVGQNIANANTPGYSRQVPEFSPVVTGGSIGSGVTITNVLRESDSLINQAVTQNTSESATTNTTLPVLQQIESYLGTGSGSIADGFNSFFNDVEQLTSQPDNSAQQGVVLNDLSNLTGTFNQAAANLQTITANSQAQITTVVNQINTLAPQIANLNNEIQQQEISGGNANGLQDQRDQLIGQLAQLVDVRTNAQPNGVTNVFAAGVPLVVSGLAGSLQVTNSPGGQITVNAVNSTASASVTGGQLAGLLQLVNQTVPSYNSQLNALASTFAQAVNNVQATGLGAGGSFTTLAGSLGVSSTSVPVASANPAFPVQAGTLSVTITNQATGQQTLAQVAIDPTTQSLSQIAANITTATGGEVQATVNAASNTLQFQAQSGYTFDFTGRSPTSPTLNGFAGTTVPTLSGVFTGPNNQYTFQVVGSGTVGQTQGLTLQVTDQNNAPVATLNIGAGYTPGTPIAVGNGVSIQLSAGTFTGGSFTYPVVSQPDTSGLLTALGVNSLINGTSAGNVAVNPTVLNTPSLLATSKTGQPSDGSNVQQLLALRDQPALSNGTTTFQGFYANLVGQIGTQVQQATNTQTAQQSLGTQLQQEQQSVSGVDTNQEMVSLLQYQQSYQMAAKYLSIVDDTLNSLLNVN